ncbi:MAG: hypothetical protein ABIA97_04920 [Candidatus Omnitrophota bacterium]
MMKIVRLFVCLAVIAMSSIVTLNPSSVFAKQKEERVTNKESVVYVTKNGKKYHKETCPFIKNRETVNMDEKEAIAKGLKPCGKCFKDDNEN